MELFRTLKAISGRPAGRPDGIYPRPLLRLEHLAVLIIIIIFSKDYISTFPWMAPGSAPVYTPCGAAGGNPLGIVAIGMIVINYHHEHLDHTHFSPQPFNHPHHHPTPHLPSQSYFQVALRAPQGDQDRTAATLTAVALPMGPMLKTLTSKVFETSVMMLMMMRRIAMMMMMMMMAIMAVALPNDPTDIENFYFQDVVVTEWTIGATEVAGWGQVYIVVFAIILIVMTIPFRWQIMEVAIAIVCASWVLVSEQPSGKL